MPQKTLVIDQWAAASYKPGFTESGAIWTAPNWVGEDHHRRLQAYTLLASYLENVAREWLETADEETRSQRREYGDPNLIVETIVAAILGEDVRIHVEGEEGEPQDGNEPSGAPLPNKVDPKVQAILDWIEKWEDAERPILSVIETEEDAVGLGDGVYVISWDGEKKRPTVTPYDPGFYFPVLDDANVRDFPHRVHIAWEFEKDRGGVEAGTKDTMVRRITWELKDVPAYSVPWSTEQVTKSCFLTNLTMKVPDENSRDVDTFDVSGATYETNADGQELNELDLKIDFIPVVHMPNTIARKKTYGRSSLLMVLQILDEIAATDTDLALSARTTGFPPLGVEGTLSTGEDGHTITTYGPGTVLSGKIYAVDTSTSLDALLKYIEHLLKRLSVNTRIPETILGRGKPSDYTSGYDRSLSFGPLKAMVTKMRQVRDEKYPLVFKFVLRFAQQAGEIKPGELPKTTLLFGRFLPQERQTIVEMVMKLLEAKAISRLTAVRMLIEEAGIPETDAIREVAEIQTTDFDGAKDLAEATGSANLAAEYLQLELPDPLEEPDALKAAAAAEAAAAAAEKAAAEEPDEPTEPPTAPEE